MYKSTRGKKLYHASRCIYKGLADDGGLFVPNKIDKITIDEDFLKLTYKEISFIILKSFLDDFTDEEITDVIESSYNNKNFPDGMYNLTVKNDIAFIELYSGPTLAFKDMALTMLPHLMRVAKTKLGIKKKTLVLVATSGDTGSAALSGFKDVEGIDVMVLYPNNGVSQVQEAQMLSFKGTNCKVYAYNGNFDDCQSMVKEIFNDYKGPLDLSSANSINIGRLIPQIIYYFDAYKDLVNKKVIELNEKINISVPTGNFGNILASYIAKMMGLPINDFICASNENDVLTDFFKTGIYNKNRVFKKTNSPSMDILISSNFERLLYFVSEDYEYVSKLMQQLKEKGEYRIDQALFKKMDSFEGYKVTEEETVLTIENLYSQKNYLVDPHTAVAYKASCDYESMYNDHLKCLVVSTASPYKFSKTISSALHIKELVSEVDMIEEISNITGIQVPKVLKKVLASKTNKEVLNNKMEVLKYINE